MSAPRSSPLPPVLALVLLGLSACAPPGRAPRRGPEGGRHPEARGGTRTELRPRTPDRTARLPEQLRGEAFLRLEVRGVPGTDGLEISDAWIDPDDGRLLGLSFTLEGGRPAWLELSSLRLVTHEGGLHLEPATPPEEVVKPAPELDVHALFDGDRAGELAEDLAGEVLATEVVGEGLGQVWVVRLRDGANLLHRVMLPAPGLVHRALPRLREGETVSFRARPTRDQRGRLWVAESVRAGDRSLRLRDAAGELRWDELRGDLRSGRSLAGSAVEDPAGRRMGVVDFVVDRASARVLGLLVVRDAAERLVPWSRVDPDPEGGWRCSVDPETLEPFEAAEDEVVGVLDATAPG